MQTSAALPTRARLWRATGMALLAAASILVTAVLPAEYGIDPTGLGQRLGLLKLRQAASPGSGAVAPDDPAAELAARAAAVFGANDGQGFASSAVRTSASAMRSDAITIAIAPGGGAEVKARLKAGDGFVFHWRATGEVAMDMHGERPDAKDAYTTYAIEAARREASGTFTAPFDGQHGWYFNNRGKDPVQIDVTVTGFQTSLFQPGH